MNSASTPTRDVVSRITMWTVPIGGIAFAGFGFFWGVPILLALLDGSASPRNLQNNYMLPYHMSVHVIAAAFALLIGLLQMWTWLRSTRPKVHKWLGRLYVAFVLPSGLAAIFLLPRTFSLGSGYATSIWGSAWLACTIIGVIAIRRRDIAGHRRWMFRSYALAWTGVTIRLYFWLTEQIGIPLDVLYPLSAILAVATNLLFVEWILRRDKPSSSAPITGDRGSSTLFPGRSMATTALVVLGLVGLSIAAARTQQEFSLAAQAKDDAQMRRDMHRFKDALISYRARHGRYPETRKLAACEHPIHKKYYDELTATLMSGGHLKAPLTNPVRHVRGFGYCYGVLSENGKSTALVWAPLRLSPSNKTGEPGTCRPFTIITVCSSAIANRDYCLCLPEN